ncbi:N-acetylmuramate/N-acetylglucosamine kinase AmgK [Asticcacaulis machinosus]|uniref:Phosphotransferase n=1 Tax=Asticcacaulis machinosus TaxID=2984211 RepID=A0ABT5HKV3_9CAUL|nr:phosphotransferase [Asticcacaulis machinosus]MDC7676858.1 phosphotransferase [Asticcacaulis machinosus]
MATTNKAQMIPDRETQKIALLKAHGLAGMARTPLPGDASTRRYERLSAEGRSLMLMDQPPSPELIPCPPEADYAERKRLGYFAMTRLSAGRIEAFAACADYLRSESLSAPEIVACDPQAGFLVSEDLGDGLFARLIEQGEDETRLYLSAVEALSVLHQTPPPDTLPGGWPLLVYDDLALKTGADLFVEWYPKYDPSCVLDDQAKADWEGIWAPIRARAEAGASVFIHRDFHAENLLWLPERNGYQRVGLIDFQDALKGHPSWDLHSLLQDARRDVSPDIEAAALEHYFALRPDTDRAAFMEMYQALATLNEARILGVFARLIIHFKKPRYEAFMPRMWGHLSRNLKAPHLKSIREWFEAYGFGDKLS